MMTLTKKLPGLGYVFSTSTFRQSSITFVGTVINAFFGAIFYILVARFLGPVGFGIMSVALAVMSMVSDIGDLGTNTGIVNFVPRYLKEEAQNARKVLKLGLEVKVLVSVLMLLLGLFFSDFVAATFFAKPELAAPLKIAFVGVGASLLFSFAVSALQSFQRFWAWSNIQIATNAFRVLLILFLLSSGFLTVGNTMWVYISMPLLGFLVGLFLIKPDFLKVKNEWDVAVHFFAYNKWVAAFTVLAAFSGRLDTFITARLLDAGQVGIYSAANQLVKIVPQIVVALGTVIAPKMASMGTIKDFLGYLKKTQAMVLGLAVLGLFSIPVVLWLIPALFGVEYLDSGPIFVILLFAQLVFLISVPVHNATFYYFSNPKLFFWLSIVHLLIVGLLGWILISYYGVTGAAFAVLVGNVANLIIPSLWLFKKVKNVLAETSIAGWESALMLT